ncbi:MAG: hypothetical protein LBF15_00350 [Candidatus Peribacteria bacterium]|nr:hypothetical protein [Candidatus Peribacteria bacterium]
MINTTTNANSLTTETLNRVSVQSIVANTNSKSEKLSEFNKQIIEEAVILKNSSNANKEKAKNNLKNTVNQRKNHTINTMKNNPKEFLENAISSELSETLFKDIDGIEQKITLEGKIEIICELGEHDNEDESHAHEDIFIVTEDGTYYEVHFADEEIKYDLVPGDEVKATGYELENNFVPDTLTNSSNFEIVAAAEVLSLVNATVNRVAVILVNFDINNSQPFSKTQIQSTMSQAREWYEETTLGNVTYAGKNDSLVDIYGYYTVPYNNCDYISWMTEAQKVAMKDGFSASGYRHVMLVFPRPVSTCESGVAGRGTLGGPNTRLFGTISLGTVVHEMGHNWGFHHARSATCVDTAGNRVPVSDNCTYSEYGDPYDVMGTSGNQRQFQAFSKNNIGWMPNSNRQTISADGVYELYPIEQIVTTTQVLYIPITYKNNNGINTTWNYYVDFRGLGSVTGSKYDNYTTTSPATRGVMIRQASSRGSYTNLFKANATTTTSFTSAPLEVGQTFSDPIRKVDIKVLSVDNAKATVEVKFTGDSTPVCVKSDSAVRITPSTLTAAPGEAVTYTVNITNNNSKECASESFTMSLSNIPTGFTTNKTTDTVTLASGGSATLTYIMTSPLDSYNGIYDFLFVENRNKTYNAQYVITKSEDKPVCVRGTTSVSVTPLSEKVKPGTTIDYKISIKNNDYACGTTPFTISGATPNGSWTLGNSVNKSLNSGEEFETIIKVSSKSNEKNGTYNIPFTVRNNSTNTSSIVTATYVIDSNNTTGGGTTTTTTITTSGITDGAKLGNGNNKFQVTASHASGISTIEIYLNDEKVTTCSNPKNGICEYSINANKIDAGTYVLKVDVTANDSAKTKSSKTITFTK